GVVRTLWPWKATFGKAQWPAVLIKEILLLETEPCVRIIWNRRARVRRMRRFPVRHHHFAHHQNAILARAVGKHRDGLQHTIRTLPLRLLRGASIKPPIGEFFELRQAAKVFNLSFA